MIDTGFHVASEKLDRLPPYREPDLAPIDDGLWTEPPIFPSGSAASSRRLPTGTASGACWSQTARASVT